MIQLRNLSADLKNMVLSANQMIPGMADRYIIAAAAGQPLSYWQDKLNGEKVYNTIASALAAMTSGRNDVALLAPDSHNQAATLTWDKNMCHLIGAYGPARQNHRARIGHSANFSPLMSITGYGNTFAGMYMMHGRGSASNLVGLAIGGERNSFIGCHFLPANATELDQANYRLVTIDKAEQYFLGCTFGSDTVAWTNGAMIKLGVSSDGGPPRVVFEDCIFYMYADNNQVRFLDASLAGMGRALMVFKNCAFINVGTALAYAINGAGLSNAQMFFDANCSFAGCTEVVEAGYENYVWCGCANLGGTDWIGGGDAKKLGNMIASHPDVS
jgi:hypothetical protein